jgi:glycopeptide antibiotics resistance protein
MKQMNSDPSQPPAYRNWSNRILAASLFGILFFTLFPYWIDFSQKHAQGRSPFLLGGPLKFDGILHTFLNALLFAPFGFALSQFFPARRRPLLKSIALAVAAGAALSYSIEIVQLYLPSRDSAWDDVLANTAGTLAGIIFGLVSGGFIYRKLSVWEIHLEQILSLRKISIAALAYFGLWVAISIPLQQKTHLDNWDPNSFLVVGYNANAGTRWSGAVSRIQLWDRALDAAQALALTRNTGGSDGSSIALDSHLLASYDLSQPPPIVNRAGPLPNLDLRSNANLPGTSHQSRDGQIVSVLVSETQVPALSVAVRHSNQFSVLVDCMPRGPNDTDGAILAITNFSGESDLVLWQDHSYLLALVRNRLDSKKSSLAAHTGRVFISGVTHSIFFSYDGAQGSFYIDGKREPHSYYLGPGASLVGEFIRLKTEELVAYSGLYVSLVFLPMGFLLGLAIRIIPRQKIFYKLGICAGIFLPAILLEVVLVCVSGRSASMIQLGWSIGLTLAGMLWINLDPSIKA